MCRLGRKAAEMIDSQAAHTYVKEPIGIPEHKQYCNSKLPSCSRKGKNGTKQNNNSIYA